MRNWIEFWNADHAIYVNETHKALHANAIAADIARHIQHPDAVVVDYGCGEALYADALLDKCGRLILCEAAPSIKQALHDRLSDRSKITVLDPNGVRELPPNSTDLIVANSLLQYLQKDELESLLDVWHAKLKPDGRLVLADVIPPGVSPVTDASALLRFATKGGFLLPAVAGLVRTAMSDYGRIRQQLGFSMYREAELIDLLAKHGLIASRVHPNFGHNQARMTFSAQRH